MKLSGSVLECQSPLKLSLAVLVAGFSAGQANASLIPYSIVTVAQTGTVVGGYTLTNNLAFASISPDDNYVAYQANYSQNGVSHNGIFASDGSAVAVSGEQIGGATISYFAGQGPYVNASHSVMFEAGNTAGYTDAFTGTSLLSDDYISYPGNNRAYNIMPVGYSDSGSFLGEYQGSQADYFGNGTSLLNQITHTNISSVVSNNSGQGAYSTTSNALYDLQNNLLAAAGTVIGGYALSSVGFGGDPVAINNNGTIAFVGFWNGGANCGIFTLTALVKDISGSCNVTGLNINDNGEVAWLNNSDAIYTQYGLVTSSAVNVGARFLNNLGSLTFEDAAGQIELATQISSAPEPSTFWLALIASGIGWRLRSNKSQASYRYRTSVR